MALPPVARLLVAVLVAFALAAPAAARSRAGADGRFETRRSAHFVLLQDVAIDQRTGPQGSRQFEREVLEALEAGYDRLDELLGLRPPRRLEVRIYDPALFDQAYAGLVRFRMAGFYRGSIRVRGDVRVTPALVRTLHHELVHAALDAAAPSAWLPAWLNEGLAEWFEARASGLPPITAREHAALARLGAEGGLLPLDALSESSFARLDAAAAPLAYLQARALVDHLARSRGERALRDVVARLVRTGDPEQALARVTGTGAAGLEASLYAELGLVR